MCRIATLAIYCQELTELNLLHKCFKEAEGKSQKVDLCWHFQIRKIAAVRKCDVLHRSTFDRTSQMFKELILNLSQHLTCKFEFSAMLSKVRRTEEHPS